MKKSTVVTRRQAKALEAAGGTRYNPRKYDYRPTNHRSHTRHQLRRYAKPKPPAPGKSSIYLKAGGTMMVAGKILPVLAVGYIAHDLVSDRPQTGQEGADRTAEFFLGSAFVDTFGSDGTGWTRAVSTYQTVNYAYGIGKSLLLG